MNARDYLVIIEPTNTGFSAYSPDIDGCITVGQTVEETRKNMEEAVELYLEELSETGESIPLPGSLKDKINILEAVSKDSFIAFIHVPHHAKSA